MTNHKLISIRTFLLTLLLLGSTAIVNAQQRIARTVSPSMVIRVLGFQDIKPQDLHSLQKLYESTGWKILKMDDDPSDGEMSVWGGRNMELALDEFAITGTDKPNNGIFIHLTKDNGFKVDFIKIVFNDEQEENLFKDILPRYNITSISDNEYEGTIQLKSGQSAKLTCNFDYEGMNPKVEIGIERSDE